MAYKRNHGMKGTRINNIWHSMKQRCNDKNHRNYRWYGAKGIKVCDEWQDFIPFMEWAMTNGYSDNLTLDRIESDKNYEPTNCRWITREENASRATSGNKRPDNLDRTDKYEFNGRSLTLKEWATETGINYRTLIDRLRKQNMPIEEALTKKVRAR